MTLQQVKAMLFKLPLNGVIKEGLCYSEPILSIQDNRIIDNFFVYGIDYIEDVYSGPLAVFGIYADTCEVAYIAENPTDFFHLDCGITFPIIIGAEDLKQVYKVYEQAYSSVRELFMEKQCTQAEKELLLAYIHAFQKIVYSGLWDFYKELGKSFFDWIREQLGDE